MVLSIRNAVNDKPHVTHNAKKINRSWWEEIIYAIIYAIYEIIYARVPIFYPEVGTALKKKRTDFVRLSLYLLHLTFLC